jgi:hypothetical protein
MRFILPSNDLDRKVTQSNQPMSRLSIKTRFTGLPRLGRWLNERQRLKKKAGTNLSLRKSGLASAIGGYPSFMGPFYPT